MLCRVPRYGAGALGGPPDSTTRPSRSGSISVVRCWRGGWARADAGNLGPPRYGVAARHARGGSRQAGPRIDDGAGPAVPPVPCCFMVSTLECGVMRVGPPIIPHIIASCRDASSCQCLRAVQYFLNPPQGDDCTGYMGEQGDPPVIAQGPAAASRAVPNCRWIFFFFLFQAQRLPCTAHHRMWSSFS